MGRPPCCDKANVKRGLWTAEEDAKILAYVSNYGIGNWTQVPKKAGLNRCGKSCRLRWTNYLRPDLKHEEFTQQEEELIVKFHAAIGSRWSLIAKQLPGRTDNDVKNYWNTKLKKKLAKMGIDPMTHKPIVKIISDYETITSSTSNNNTNLNNIISSTILVDHEGQIKNTNYFSNNNNNNNNNNNPFLNQLSDLDLVEHGSFNLEEISSSSSSSSTISNARKSRNNVMLANNNGLLSCTLINTKTTSTYNNCKDESCLLIDNSHINVDNKPMPQCLVGIGEKYYNTEDYCVVNGGNTRRTTAVSDQSSSSENSFVKAMLERDCQMQQEFSIFEDIILDY